MLRKHMHLAMMTLLLVLLSGAVSAESAEVEMLHGVAYAEEPHPEQYLDFYWPTEAPDATILFIHGGSLRENGERRSSEMYADICPAFAAAGVGCATIDYRLAPSFQWPAMPDDVAAAILRVRELVEQRAGNPDRVFLFGHSSGCHLAATIGMNPVHLDAAGLSTNQIAGIIAMGCTLDRYDAAIKEIDVAKLRAHFERDADDAERFGSAENWIAANPAHHLGSHVPPLLVLVAEHERFFPPILEQGARVVRRLLEIDRPAELVIVPGTHKSSVSDIGKPGDPSFEAILKFMKRSDSGIESAEPESDRRKVGARRKVGVAP